VEYQHWGNVVPFIGLEVVLDASCVGTLGGGGSVEDM
jgi:hypothetical protein